MDLQIINNYKSFAQLYDKSWAGAIQTLDIIKENNKCYELEELLNELFNDQIITETQLNDFLWFDSDYIFNELNIKIEE